MEEDGSQGAVAALGRCKSHPSLAPHGFQGCSPFHHPRDDEHPYWLTAQYRTDDANGSPPTRE